MQGLPTAWAKDLEEISKTPVISECAKTSPLSSQLSAPQVSPPSNDHWTRSAMIFLYRALRIGKLINYAPASVQRWKHKAFYEEQIKARPKLVMEDALRPMYRDGLTRLVEKYGADSLGDYFEFGVYHGTSLITMYRVLRDLGLSHVRLFGFDSFEGLPATPDVDNHWQPGEFKSDYQLTLKVLEVEQVNMNRVVLTKGFFDTTLTPELKQRHAFRKASVIMVDCDMYSGAKEALTFCAPFILDEALIVFDDWYVLADKGGGEKRAFQEFLHEHPCFTAEEFGDYLPYGKVVFVKRARLEAMIVRELDGTIKCWTKEAELMYGWTQEEVMGTTSHSLLKTEFPALLSTIEEEVVQKTSWQGTLIHKRRDGSPVTVNSRWAMQHNQQDRAPTVIEVNTEI
jgi:O-methyltransferase